MLYCGFAEQARHEHMSDEYKDRCIISALLKIPPRYYRQYKTPLVLITRLNKKVLWSNTTKDLPNTHRRSTTETAMNPIGQAFPVIHMHLVGNSEQSQTLNGNVNIYNFVKNSRLTNEDIKIQMETTRSKY